ncbi:MAG TPA: phosphate signaling complex protein PhoU [Candidatus Avipropionibacterium avicola]|uniref:Phosphate-specific transport system accessory protein PhoU n=1 Tax=Candidatus Avipropionibacterium avicola TaxID=2840701 RepID=A0A9D1KL00_9ACTN|nr:phosphate signaling complex protein PhoU [Candidatus Avipropionibacterium avicola]
MRESYREQLDEILSDLVAMSERIATAVRRATRALLQVDRTEAEWVISSDEQIDQMRADIDARAFSLLALQAPVAGELRLLVATLRMVTEMERMGDLAAHVAKIARMRYPEPAVPEDLRGNFARMAEVAEAMVLGVGRALQEKDIDDAEAVQQRDDEMDDLRRSQFRLMLGDDWPHGVEAAVDVALLGRYYERIADHADAIARRLVYIVTGQLPEEDAVTSS